MKHFLFYSLMISFLLSCMPEQDLPLRDMGTPPPYFIECYCEPGQPYALSATTVLPVSEKLSVQFIANLKVKITAQEKVELNPLLYLPPGSELTYNYNSEEIFDPNTTDSLYLEIRTPEGALISGETPVPAAVEIHSVRLSRDEVQTGFYNSGSPGTNYYILTVEMLDAYHTVLGKEVAYLNYSEYPLFQYIEKKLALPDQPLTKSLLLNLKRITQANYEYQVSLNAANTANQSSLTTPVPLKGNLQGALGIFTCYTQDQQIIFVSDTH